MPAIKFCFNGWVNGLEVESLIEIATQQKIDVSQKTSAEVVKMLESGDYSISLADSLDAAAEVETSLFDYEADD